MKKRICFILTVLLFAAIGIPPRALPGETAPAPQGAHAESSESELELELELQPEQEQEPELESEPASELPAPPAAAPSPESAEALARAALAPDEAVVTTYAELKTALEDKTITTVYLGADITMAGGASIPSAKPSVTVSGLNPLTPEQTMPFTLTDYSSSTFTNTINVSNTGVQTLTVRDLTIVGKNFYGPFSALAASASPNLVMTFERVTYNGPQFAHHRTGTVRIIDSAFYIHNRNGGSARQEFSEVKHLYFGGTNSITTETTEFSVFWHPGGGTFELADDARLTVITPSTTMTYGLFYGGGAANAISVTIGERAVFDAVTSTTMTNGNAVIGGLTVKAGGSFSLRNTSSRIYPVLHMSGPLTVEENASFYLFAYGNKDRALLRQESGDITIGKNATFHVIAENQHLALIQLVSTGSRTYRMTCNDPASVLLINDGQVLRAETYPGDFSFAAGQFNVWDGIPPGGQNDPPRVKWEKADGSPVAIDGRLAAGSDTNFSSLTSNHTAQDPPGTSPDLQSFSAKVLRVLAFGRLEVDLTVPPAGAQLITGVTVPGAALRAALFRDGVEISMPGAVATADASGIFRIPTDIPLEKGDLVVVTALWNYLSASAEAVVTGGAGSLSLAAPATLRFLSTPLSARPIRVGRANPDWQLTVTDTRVGGAGWSLYARLEGDLTPAASNLPALRNAVTFTDADGGTVPLPVGTDLLIAAGSPSGSGTSFPVVWPESSGILLHILPGTAYADTRYTASISWTLVDAP